MTCFQASHQHNALIRAADTVDVVDAVYGQGRHAGELAHGGQPLAEQRSLHGGKAVADLFSTAVLRLRGEDAFRWLHSLTTQKVDDLSPGVSTETLVLSPTGHIEHWLRIIAASDGDGMWLLVDSDPQPVMDFFERMKFMMRAELVDESAHYQCVGVVSADSDFPLLQHLPHAAVWYDPWPNIGVGGASYAVWDEGQPQAAAEHPGFHTRFAVAVCPKRRLGEAMPHAEVPVVGRDAWEALRIAACRPAPSDCDHKALVGEYDLLRTAVHLAKGCYRGQEAVARVHNVGQTPRRLVFVHLDGSEHVLPQPGSPITAEVRGARREVGRLCSVTQHYELGPVALGVVKRNLDTNADLQIVTSEDGEENLHLAASAELVVVPNRSSQVKTVRRNPEVDQRSFRR